jgi:hypothetical protein
MPLIWRSHEDNVRRLRQRIFKAEQQQDLAAVKNLQTLRRLRGLLELLAVKAARAVLRGDRRSNPPVLPDCSGPAAFSEGFAPDRLSRDDVEPDLHLGQP